MLSQPSLTVQLYRARDGVSCAAFYHTLGRCARLRDMIFAELMILASEAIARARIGGRFSYETITMLVSLRSLIFTCAMVLPLILLWAAPALAQNGEAGDDSDASVKLFMRGQDLHARGDALVRAHREGEAEPLLRQALSLYEEAIKARPEFPEAEYQRGNALLSLKRYGEAEAAFRRAIELRDDWALPYASLGSLLVRAGSADKAEPVLRRALELDAENLTALTALADLRTRAGDVHGALELWRRATATAKPTAAAWVGRAMAENAIGDRAAALASLDRALALDSSNWVAHLERAEFLLADGAPEKRERALADLRALQEAARTDARLAVNVAGLYLRAEHRAEALQTLDGLDEELKKSPEVIAERDQIAADSENGAEARAALEEIIKRDPRNAPALARLGALYRTTDPERSLEYYRRAAEIEPRNADYATGYGAALVQARRFAEAADLLRRITRVAPDNYTAHANLATALDELKLYDQALVEYEWINKAKPDLAVTYFFIARAHDLLGQYKEALTAYETFLARADPQKNELEIEKVNLRLPSLRRQVARGEKPPKRNH